MVCKVANGIYNAIDEYSPHRTEVDMCRKLDNPAAVGRRLREYREHSDVEIDSSGRVNKHKLLDSRRQAQDIDVSTFSSSLHPGALALNAHSGCVRPPPDGRRPNGHRSGLKRDVGPVRSPVLTVLFSTDANSCCRATAVERILTYPLPAQRSALGPTLIPLQPCSASESST